MGSLGCMHTTKSMVVLLYTTVTCTKEACSYKESICTCCLLYYGIHTLLTRLFHCQKNLSCHATTQLYQCQKNLLCQHTIGRSSSKVSINDVKLKKGGIFHQIKIKSIQQFSSCQMQTQTCNFNRSIFLHLSLRKHEKRNTKVNLTIQN